MNLLHIKSSITIHEENNLDIHIIEYYIGRWLTVYARRVRTHLYYSNSLEWKSRWQA